jgi:chemotaxis protein histidine kinase CheA
MVKTQIEALGGNITVKSELGEGTEFIILLPV